MPPPYCRSYAAPARIRPPRINANIVGSWRRCALDYSLDPARHYAPTVIDAPALAARCDQHADLLHIASAEIDWLYEYIAESGYALILTDAIGHRSLRKERHDAREHVSWCRAADRRELERALRRDERHRHVHRREQAGDRASRRTLSRQSHRAHLLRLADTRPCRLARRRAGRLDTQCSSIARAAWGTPWRW